MQGYNAIVVFDEAGEKLLMCKRSKDPYKGKLNFVGGKIEPGEEGLAAAYRELCEETAITAQDIQLTHLMDFTYHLSNCYLEVYAGRLNKAVHVSGEENELCWEETDQDFFNTHLFAGEGNIGHILMHVEMASEAVLR